MRMIERRSRSLAMVLEDHDVLKTTVLLEIENPVTKCPEQVFHPFYRHGGQSFHMVGGLNDHLMSADAVHLVEHSIGLAVQVTFNTQSRKFVRHHTQVPVCVALAAIFSRPIRQNFRRRLSFIARTKRAETGRLDVGTLAGEISGAFGTVSGNDYPTSRYGIFSQFRHENILQPMQWL